MPVSVLRLKTFHQSFCAPAVCIFARVRRWEQEHHAADESNNEWGKGKRNRHICTLCKYLAKGREVNANVCSCTYLKSTCRLLLKKCGVIFERDSFQSLLVLNVVVAIWKWVKVMMLEDRRGFIVTEIFFGLERPLNIMSWLFNLKQANNLVWSKINAYIN